MTAPKTILQRIADGDKFTTKECKQLAKELVTSIDNVKELTERLTALAGAELPPAPGIMAGELEERFPAFEGLDQSLEETNDDIFVAGEMVKALQAYVSATNDFRETIPDTATVGDPQFRAEARQALVTFAGQVEAARLELAELGIDPAVDYDLTAPRETEDANKA